MKNGGWKTEPKSFDKPFDFRLNMLRKWSVGKSIICLQHRGNYGRTEETERTTEDRYF